MAVLDKIEFGNNIRKARLSKGLSLENLGKAINKNATTIFRFEKGEIIPNAIQINLICNELGISEYELFNSDEKINNLENSNNPFGVKTLFIAYMAYYQKSNKYDLAKFKLNIIEKPEKCIVDLVDYKTNKIYLSGYMLADSNVAMIVLENYKPNNLRLEVTHIILNIAKGTEKSILGSLHCTNGNYVPSVRKCLVSKNDFELNDTILNKIKISKDEKKELNSKEILYLDLIDKEDFEE